LSGATPSCRTDSVRAHMEPRIRARGAHRLADSLKIFLTAAPDVPVFKLLRGQTEEFGESGAISCDALEVVDWLGLEGDLSASLVREAMEGLAESNFGRTEQARLAVLMSYLLKEASELQGQCLTIWTIRESLKHVEHIAAARLDRLAAERLAAEVTNAAGVSGIAAIMHEQATGVMDDNDEQDDVGWFFEVAEAKSTQVDPLPSCNTPTSHVKPILPCTMPKSQVAFAETVPEICRVLAQRCVPCAPSCEQAPEFRGHNHHCFVYASVKPCVEPLVVLRRGVVCHVLRDSTTVPMPFLGRERCVHRALFIDADLTEAAYESCAPRSRRIVETVTMTWQPGQGAQQLLQPTLDASHGASVGRDLEQLLSARNIGAIFTSGIVSGVVIHTCQHHGVPLVTLLPVPILRAMAAEAGAEILHGLPTGSGSLTERPERHFWEAQRPLNLEFNELSEERRHGCFSFPLLGHRQPLLWHQTAVGEHAVGVCLEMRALAVEVFSSGAASTVILESSCEATLRLLHAQLSEHLFSELRRREEGSLARWLPGRGVWAAAISNALEEASTEESSERLLPAVAPWLVHGEDFLASAAALQAFSRAFRSLQELEAASLSELQDDEDHLCTSAVEPHSAICTVLRRAIRTTRLLVGTVEDI